MSGRPVEQDSIHTHLLRCPLEVEHARAYWRNSSGLAHREAVQRAFEERWFGARSLPRVEVLIANFRERFDVIPRAIDVLAAWHEMTADTRALVCHWHLQFSDVLYRTFTGQFLAARLTDGQLSIRRDQVVGWITEQTNQRWRMATRIKFASRLLACAQTAGLLKGRRDPRTIQAPRVPDDALTYLVYVLRSVEFDGTPLDNPYLRSVGLSSQDAESRLRGLSAIRFQRQGEMIDMGWQYNSLIEWGAATVCLPSRLTGTVVA